MYIDSTERQVATTLGGIRDDHRNRYIWAANRLKDKRVIDAACGVGYGSTILANMATEVFGFDRDEQTIEFAKEHWNHKPNITYMVADLYTIATRKEDDGDCVVCFEALEHLVDPGTALRRFRTFAPKLICSVPNEPGFKFRGYRHHVRHYSRPQLTALLAENGWRVTEWWAQQDAKSAVVEAHTLDVEPRTIIAVCERTSVEEEPNAEVVQPEEIIGGPVPETVAIVAMGSSRSAFFEETLVNWGPIADEVWAINATGGLLDWDRCFHQDDLHIQELRVEAGKHKLGHMLDWIKDAEKPVYTARAYDGYPNAVEFPLEWVINRCGFWYHNSTVAYAVTFAIALGVKTLKLYGADFSYPGPQAAHKRERGRGCIEFWLGVAMARGMKVLLPPGTTLMDHDLAPRDKLYGYDTEWVTIQNVNGYLKVARVDRLPEDIPTAEEMELRYSHDVRKERQKPTSVKKGE